MPVSKMITKKGILQGSNATMMIGSGALIMLFIFLSSQNIEKSNAIFIQWKHFIGTNLNWYYVAIMNLCLFLAIYFAFSKYGKIRLGKDDDKPEYSFFSWFSMLFGAGIGIGILFWSIAEPMLHYQSNPFFDAATQPQEAMQFAVRTAIFHWGLHGWGIFAVIGMALAFLSYRCNLPLTVRSLLYPLFKNRVYGPIGHCADYLAVLGTIFGIATSLGLGAKQINAGLFYLFDWSISTPHQIGIIVFVTCIATAAVLTGLDHGIKWISDINMNLTFFTLGLFVIAGPTVYILASLVNNFGDYFTQSILQGFWVNTDPKSTWQEDWTIFYWGWWISWTPFVSIFIARISRGRTIKEFIIGVLLAPTLMGLLWISIFSAIGFYLEHLQPHIMTNAVNEDTTMALFSAIDLLQVNSVVTGILTLCCMMMLVTYFVTSADSATLVICSLVCLGDPHPLPRYRLFWGLAIGGCAGLLLVVGGLKALQTASVLSALPFSFIVLLAIVGLFKALREESKMTVEIDSQKLEYN